jgi:D-beta-D-heptose 7-phosphate kinase/D-beta-D-heptose 1-phosphate adenosyltransferase
MAKTTVCVSGGFDPVHIGHLRMMQEAAKYGDLIVIVNSDDWLMRKKGYIFMPFDERCEIIEGFSCVGSTTYVQDADGTVCEALRRLKPSYFANGGDRKNNNTPEMQLCTDENIELLWNVGGGKIQSSSDLVSSTPALNDLESYGGIEGCPRPSRVEVVTSDNVSKKNNNY